MVRATGSRAEPAWPLAWLLACALTSASLATSVARAQGAPEAAGDADAKADAQSSRAQSSEAPRVVFVLPELDETADAQLRDALLAQFTLVQAELSFAAPRPMGRTQLERLSSLRATSERAGALAAFYLDVEPNGRWLLHVFDAERERLVLRTLDGSGAQRPAAIEAVAVMARESTRALIEGQPVPVPLSSDLVVEALPASAPAAAPVAPAPEPAAQAAPQARAWQVPRLSAGYVVTTFGDQSPARHGAALTLGLRLHERWRVTLGADLTLPTFYAASPPFEVQAYPVRAAVAGRVAAAQALSLELEGVATLEWLRRHSRRPEAQPAPASPAEAPLEPEADDVHFVAALGLRAHGELALGGPWALWLALGSDLLLNPFAYVADRNQVRQELLALYRLRLLAQLGLALEL